MIEIAEDADDLISRLRPERVAQLISFEPFD